MGTFLKKDLNLKVISLIVAIFIWIYVYYKENPFQENQAMASFIVPLTVTGLSSNLIVLDKPENVLVNVRGNKDIISALKVEEKYITASVNLSNRAAGTYELPVQASSFSGEVVSIEPSNVQLKIDNLEFRSFPIELKFKGNLSGGFQLIANKSKIIPDKIQVKGAYEIVTQIYKVVVPVDVTDLNLSFKSSYTPVIFDKNGKILKNLTISPETVEVFAEITSDKSTKTVPIIPWIYGNLSPGYEIKEILLRPLTATIEVDAKEIDKITNVKTGPIDITGKNKNIILDVGLISQEGVEIISSGTVQIIIKIDKKPVTSEITPNPQEETE